MLNSDVYRSTFLQILDDKRERYSILDPISFDYMTVAMKVFLDNCIEPRQVKPALRLANMSITFYKVHLVNDDNNNHNLSEEDRSRYYVQREPEINQHELWHTPGFWDDALGNGLKEQMTMMEPVKWDELDPELLKEKVTG
jgi:hypothetical protein